MAYFKHPTAYYAAQKAKARDRANAGGTVRIFAVKKDGTLYKRPHEFFGKSLWTPEEAAAEIARMLDLNPGRTYRALPLVPPT